MNETDAASGVLSLAQEYCNAHLLYQELPSLNDVVAQLKLEAGVLIDLVRCVCICVCV
jgi:hypothetical protein